MWQSGCPTRPPAPSGGGPHSHPLGYGRTGGCARPSGGGVPRADQGGSEMNRHSAARSATAVGPTIGKVCCVGAEGMVWGETGSFFYVPVCEMCEMCAFGGGAKKECQRAWVDARRSFSTLCSRRERRSTDKEVFRGLFKRYDDCNVQRQVLVKGNIYLFLGVCFM